MKPALVSSLGAELGTGQIEIAFAELAVMGAVMGIKKLVSNVKEKR
jgi:hypothetical protein